MAVRVPKRVVVRELGKIVVARVGVAASAIGESIADRVVVIPLYDWNPRVLQNPADSIGKGAKRAKIAEAIEMLDTPLHCIVEKGFQSKVVTIHAAEKTDTLPGV
jgi:hypothetical protein